LSQPADPQPHRQSAVLKAGRKALVLVTAFFGLRWLYGAYAMLRDQRAGVWPMALMLCVLAAGALTLTFTLIRTTRRIRTDSPAEAPKSEQD
jgi:hypothetical protein